MKGSGLQPVGLRQIGGVLASPISPSDIKLNFQEFYRQTTRTAETFLMKWYFWATHGRLEPVQKAAYTIKNHWDGVLRWYTSRINNGTLEGINSLIQAATAGVRGYRTERPLTTMIYLIAGKFKFDLPT